MHTLVVTTIDLKRNNPKMLKTTKNCMIRLCLQGIILITGGSNGKETVQSNSLLQYCKYAN